MTATAATPQRLTETLPADWYWDDAVHRREREAILAPSWFLLARAEQLQAPGDYVAGEVAGKPLFALRGRDGSLRAFHNVCLHRAGPLVREAAGRCQLLRCAYHGWAYDLSGRLKRAPGFEAAPGFEVARFTLPEARVETWQGLVFVCLDRGAPGLADWLGDIAAVAREFPALRDLAYHGEVTREGAANWKTYADNSAEGYHLPLVHPGLARSTPRAAIEVGAYENGRFVGFRVAYDGARGQAGRSGRAFWMFKFPWLLLHFSETGINIEQVIPLGPRRIRLVRRFWFAGPDPDAADAAVADSAGVMAEDLAICEAVQRNLEAGVYRQGLLSPETEAGTIYVQSLVRRALAGPEGSCP